MADNNNNMTYQDAYDLLIHNIYAPVFFEKLSADYGIRPNSEDEAREMLTLAGKLQQTEELNVQKQAADRSSLVNQANQSLDMLLNEAGVPVAKPTGYHENEIKEAAAQLAQVEQFRNAALLYQDAMSQLLAKQ